MSKSVSTQASESGVPSARQFTSSPLRNRLRVELHAPVADVWELMGDLSRFPEYSDGLERVDVEHDEKGRCTAFTCFFKPVDKDAEGAVSRDVMKWYEPNRGYLSVEVEGNAGTENAVAFMTLDPFPGGTRLTYDMHFDAEDVATARAQPHEVNADMARRLIARFGGKVIERYVER